MTKDTEQSSQTLADALKQLNEFVSEMMRDATTTSQAINPVKDLVEISTKLSEKFTGDPTAGLQNFIKHASEGKFAADSVRELGEIFSAGLDRLTQGQLAIIDSWQQHLRSSLEALRTPKNPEAALAAYITESIGLFKDLKAKAGTQLNAGNTLYAAWMAWMDNTLTALTGPARK